LNSSFNEDEDLVLDRIDKLGNYYRGTICKLHRSPERGKVRSATGREVAFVFAHVIMSGSLRRFEDLREGMEVGYDVGWTSKGLRVHVIWTPGERPPAVDLEGQGSAEDDESTQHLADEHGEDGNVE
jgi:hypothetical protein